ncbi:MAG: DNA-processing protein DprA [Salinivirgaceae bacterium]|nr:DNA-processing protein DprA [Salinivirgaceae bacterium]
MSLTQEELRHYLALWSVSGIGSMISRKLIAHVGSPQAVLELSKPKLSKINGVGPKLIESLVEGGHYEKADKELEFVEKYNIRITSIFDDDYPFRLKQCEDAPLLFFTKGQPLNENKKYISIVGTRNSTAYGNDFCQNFISRLKEKGHDAVIISGLAYGIDIAAHKAALKNQIPTYGVLGHGLDRMYPAQHRKTASEMLENGGLITEFMHGVFPDKNNFVRRNRVIAGLSDATIVVESDIKGGSLITADLANSYSRDVFAVPGRLHDTYSLGTNKLIKANKAALIETVEDLEYIMGWEAVQESIQQQLFHNFSNEEQIIMDLFNKGEELNIDNICRSSGLTMSKVSAILLTLEFMGAVKCLPGKVFHKA